MGGAIDSGGGGGGGGEDGTEYKDGNFEAYAQAVRKVCG